MFADEIRAGALETSDVLVVPGGGYGGMRAQIDSLGGEGATAVADFVGAGGLYIGSCAGAYDAASPAPAFQLLSPAQERMQLTSAQVWNENRLHWADLESPGVGVIRVRNQDPSHPIMGGLPEDFEMVHYNGPLFVGGTPLLSVQGITERFTAAEDFLDRDVPRPTMIERAADLSIAAAVTDHYGEGRVALFGGHPEFGFDPGPMREQQLPRQMLLNAVRWQASRRGSRTASISAGGVSAGPSPWREVETVGDAIRAELRGLSQRRLDRGWIEAPYAMSVFGLLPQAVWTAALATMGTLLDEIVALARDVEPQVLAFEPGREDRLDFGYRGVLPLLRHARHMLEKANATWNVDLGPPMSYEYAHIHDSPYHLVAASYLAAIGWITAAALLCQCPPGVIDTSVD